MAMKGQRGIGRGASISEHAAYTIQRRNRHWEVRDPTGELVCLTVYKRGANEVVRRIAFLPTRALKR